ncbi:MAG: DUF4405 domain-containing protein [Anaerolineaceae bacterium]
MSKNELNFWLDLAMFFAFLITIVSGILLWLVIPNGNHPGVVGNDKASWLAFHEGSGVLGLLGVVIHIIRHWDWLKALRGRSLGTLKRPVRINRVVDRITWFAFISSNLFGMLAWLLPDGMPTTVIKILGRFHVVTGVVWFVFLVIHLVLHQKWIVLALKRFPLFHPVSSNFLNNES